VLKTANTAGTNGLAYLPKHGGQLHTLHNSYSELFLTLSSHGTEKTRSLLNIWAFKRVSANIKEQDLNKT
jgi:hypothetical protein